MRIVELLLVGVRLADQRDAARRSLVSNSPSMAASVTG